MLNNKILHIISFDIPFPANYGGVIDVFYKIKYLHAQSIKIHLHCFEYGRSHAKELNQYCESVTYYPRETSLWSHLGFWPHIVKSRLSENLITNLIKDNNPIIFEGMHTLGMGLDKRLEHRIKIYRESNIEHQYYYYLYKAEKNLLKKLFFRIESHKLKLFEKHINKFDKTLVVSKSDKEELLHRYPKQNIYYLPSFHPDNKVNCKTGKGKYALYIGNLSVAENILAVEFLIKKVFSKIEYPFIIAGLNPSESLIKLVSTYKNISLKPNQTTNEMNNLVENAQFNVLLTFQATGLKLKLLSSLFQGRFLIVNDKMTKGTGLNKLCITANTPEEIINKIQSTKDLDFNTGSILGREKLLNQNYNNTSNIKKLIELVFEQ